MIKEKAKQLIKKYIGIHGTDNLSNRQDWIKRQLLSLPAEQRILDAGAGERQYRQHCGHLRYVSQDFNQYRGDGNGVGLQTGNWDISGIDIVSDIGNIPEPDESFDAILCTEVFEHLPDPAQALREFGRLLRHGGVLIVSAPFNSLTHFAPYHYSTGFSRYWYEHHLAIAGFRIDAIEQNGNYVDYVSQEVRRCTTYFGRCPWYVMLSIGVILRFLKVNHSNPANMALGTFGYHVRAERN